MSADESIMAGSKLGQESEQSAFAGDLKGEVAKKKDKPAAQLDGHRV